MNRLFFIIISFISLTIRIIYSYYSWYIRDHARVFDLGFQIYKYHALPLHGSPIVYTNSLLPGSLQSILAAIPLYLSHGHPYSIILFVQLLNFIACLFIYQTCQFLFPKLNKFFLFTFIILNPMNIIFSYGWNPSFIIIFSSLFFIGLVKVFQNKNSKIGLFLVFFPHLLIMQLNLQFLILAVLLLVLLIRKLIPFPPFKILFISFLPGLFTLLPLIVELFNPHRKDVSNWHMNGNIFRNIELHLENLFSYFHIVARFLSFSTGETTRNLGEGYIRHHPEMWLFFAIGMLGSAFLLCISGLFYLDKNKWKKFFKNSASLTLLEKLDLVLLYLPLISSFLFVFSVTPPTTHKIWSLFPFCFYPFCRVLSEEKISFFLKKNLQLFYKQRFKLFGIYMLSTLTYSLIGGSKIPTNFAEIFHDSKNFCKVNSEKELSAYLNQVDYSTKEYTMALMCQYWNTR